MRDNRIRTYLKLVKLHSETRYWYLSGPSFALLLQYAREIDLHRFCVGIQTGNDEECEIEADSKVWKVTISELRFQVQPRGFTVPLTSLCEMNHQNVVDWKDFCDMTLLEEYTRLGSAYATNNDLSCMTKLRRLVVEKSDFDRILMPQHELDDLVIAVYLPANC